VAADKPKKPAGTPSVELSAFGLKVAPVSDELRQKYKLDDKQKGIVITDVTPAGLAADRGLMPGDVIVEVQQQTVAVPADLQKRLTEARGQGRKTVLLLVQSKDGMRWVPLPVKA
jgi:serine protease Do